MAKQIEKLYLQDLKMSFRLYCKVRGLDDVAVRKEWNAFWGILNMKCEVVERSE